jgi:hypothetical protein
MPECAGACRGDDARSTTKRRGVLSLARFLFRKIAQRGGSDFTQPPIETFFGSSPWGLRHHAAGRRLRVERLSSTPNYPQRIRGRVPRRSLASRSASRHWLAVAAMPAELRAPGSIHRGVEAEWGRFFRPPDGSTAEVLSLRVWMRRRASLAG